MALTRASIGAAAAALAVIGRAAPASAEDVRVAHHTDDDPSTAHGRVLVDLGLGALMLPDADLCLRPGSCRVGDATIGASFWQLFRPAERWAVGAGVSLALAPGTDRLRSESPALERTHTRTYFLAEAQARWYLALSRSLEGWIGPTAGWVVLSDRYRVEGNEAFQAARIGPPGSTLRTEGPTVGALVGGALPFARDWAFVATVRAARWFLPREAATTPFGDSASLKGQQSVVDAGIAVEYRIPL